MKTKTIAELNDEFRHRLGIPAFGPKVPGAFVSTRGICNLAPEQQIDIWNQVRTFNAFSEHNDPHGEHDFGAIDYPGVGKIFWKIDYYADRAMEAGSEDPSDISKTHRVLTILLADEW